MPPKLTIAMICTLALAATVAAASFESARQASSGRTALRDRAVRFSEALEDAAQQNRLASLIPWLEPAERESLQARAALAELAVAPRRRQSLVLSQVRLAQGGRQGQAEYLVTSGDRTETGGPILVGWTRGADDTWYLDLLDR